MNCNGKQTLPFVYTGVILGRVGRTASKYLLDKSINGMNYLFQLCTECVWAIYTLFALWLMAQYLGGHWVGLRFPMWDQKNIPTRIYIRTIWKLSSYLSFLGWNALRWGKYFLRTNGLMLVWNLITRWPLHSFPTFLGTVPDFHLGNLFSSLSGNVFMVGLYPQFQG